MGVPMIASSRTDGPGWIWTRPWYLLGASDASGLTYRFHVSPEPPVWTQPPASTVTMSPGRTPTICWYDVQGAPTLGLVIVITGRLWNGRLARVKPRVCCVFVPTPVLLRIWTTVCMPVIGAV